MPPEREEEFIKATRSITHVPTSGYVTNRIKIDLSEPFEGVLARLLSIPKTDTLRDNATFPVSPEPNTEFSASYDLEMTLRYLYEAANGRQVETQIGLIAIAPPTAEFLKERPFYVETQIEFFVGAMARIIGRFSSHSSGSTSSAKTVERHSHFSELIGSNTKEGSDSARPTSMPSLFPLLSIGASQIA